MYLFSRSELSNALAGTGTNESTPSLPNPLTPMAFLPPNVASELTVETYIAVAALAIMVWDILHTIGIDYILLTKHSIRLPTIAYFISRLSSFGSLLVLTIFDTAPVGSNGVCEALAHATTWLFNIAISSTSLLLFFRVQALYSNNKIVVGIFILIWVGVCCVGVLSIMNLKASTIGPTQYCIDADTPQGTYMFGVALLVNDTLTLLATSWRLSSIHLGEEKTFRENLRSFFMGGSNLPSFSKAFLQDGQKYYLTTVGFSIFATITLYLKVIPLPYRGIVGTFDVIILNIMACRVFRNTKLGLYFEGQETIISRAVNDIKFTTVHVSESIQHDDGLATSQTPTSSEYPLDEIVHTSRNDILYHRQYNENHSRL